MLESKQISHQKENAMTGRRRILTGLMITLCFVAQTEAETIPFDYWYGRIIGRTQIRSIHDVYNGQTGSLITNVRVGYGNVVSVGLGNLVSVIEATQPSALEFRFYRPELSARASVGQRTRWTIDKLDWQDNLQVSISPPSYSQYSSSSNSRFETDQTISMLHKDIESDPSRSLYYYTKGMVLQPRNWNLDARFGITIRDSEMLLVRQSRLSGQTLVPRYQREVVDDRRDWLFAPTFGYGVSQRLEITTGLVIGRGTQPYSYDEQSGTSETPDTLSLQSFGDMDRSSRQYGAFIHPVFFLSNNHWAHLRASVNTSRTDSDARGHIESELTITSNYHDITSRKVDTYSLSLDHTWISKNVIVPRQQILDDKTQYYRQRLAPGTLRVNTSAFASFNRTDLDQSSQNNALPIRSSSSWSTSDQIRFASQATYYSPFNLDFNLHLFLVRRSDGTGSNREPERYQHYESYGYSFGVNYYSYRWSPDRRQSISWDRISDIDYLYGPLLRTHDWRASVSVMPPTHNWSIVNTDGDVFSFHKGESDNRWSTTVSAAIGLCEGVEAGLGVQYYQEQYSTIRVVDDSIWNLYRNDIWTLAPQLRWQPSERFRADFTATETYTDRDRLFHFGEHEETSHEYRHTWAIKVVYSILI